MGLEKIIGFRGAQRELEGFAGVNRCLEAFTWFRGDYRRLVRF